jgi:hypothetical protein
MKKSLVVLAVCLAPAAAYAQDSYTNADLAKFQVPGAYTNEDLKRLPSLPVAKATPTTRPSQVAPEPAPSGAMQAWVDSINAERSRLEAEVAVEKELVEFSESAFAGDTRSFDVRLGYRAQARPLIIELNKRIAILDREMDEALDQARKAGVSVDRR